MTPTRITAAAILVLALPLYAGNMVFVDRPITKALPLDIAGSFWIDNPAGNIEIIGVDGTTATITAVRTTIATDRDAMVEARNNTILSFEGDARMRFVRTITPPVRSQKWSSSVKYTVSVPRTVHVRVASKSAESIRVANIMGNVTVKAFNGAIVIDNVSGASIVDTVNGRVIYNYVVKPVSHAQITAVNADIEVHLPADSNFDWVAETLRGDLWTTLPFRGRWAGRTFRGSINAPGGPTLATGTMLGRVVVLANGASLAEARSVRTVAPEREVGGEASLRPSHMMRVQLPTVPGPFVIEQRLADVNVGEARGALRVTTGGGAIELGTVYGDCHANSGGGPISVTEVMGNLTAHTGAGDILVRAARVGGTITTDGGIVKVLYTGGPTLLRSGGGDIVVRQAAGPIEAETRSGDITVNSDPTQRTQHITAHTARGNITLNLSPRFAADVDAVVVTSDADADAIYSDFTGLQIRKEPLGGKTKVHATGKINGGGDRLELYAEEGTIHISSSSVSPASVTKR
jgi:DUF4097 and DUF4098 domain-containing protein YvlB